MRYKKQITEKDVEGLTYRNSQGNDANVSTDKVTSFEQRKDGVVIVKFYGYFWRSRSSAWDGSVYRVRWGVRKPDGRWFVDEKRKDALALMADWCAPCRSPKWRCSCSNKGVSDA